MQVPEHLHWTHAASGGGRRRPSCLRRPQHFGKRWSNSTSPQSMCCLMAATSSTWALQILRLHARAMMDSLQVMCLHAVIACDVIMQLLLDCGWVCTIVLFHSLFHASCCEMLQWKARDNKGLAITSIDMIKRQQTALFSMACQSARQ